MREGVKEFGHGAANVDALDGCLNLPTGQKVDGIDAVGGHELSGVVLMRILAGYQEQY